MIGREDGSREAPARSTAGIPWGPSVEAAPPACSGLRLAPLPIRSLLAVGKAAETSEQIGRKSNTNSLHSIPLEPRAKT